MKNDKSELADLVQSLEIEVSDMKSTLDSRIDELSLMTSKHEVKTSKVYEDLEKYVEALNERLSGVEFGWQGDLFYISKYQDYRSRSWNLKIKANADVYLTNQQRTIIGKFLECNVVASGYYVHN